MKIVSVFLNIGVLLSTLSFPIFADFPAVGNITINKDANSLTFSIYNSSERVESIIHIPKSDWNTLGELMNYRFRKDIQFSPVSPSHNHAVHIVRNLIKDDSKYELIILNLMNKSLREMPLVQNDEHLSDIYRFSWINNHLVMVDMGPGYNEVFLADIEKGTVNKFDFACIPFWDNNGKNRIERYYNPTAYSKPKRCCDSRNKMTNYIRYNGFWVYPKPMRGPMTQYEFLYTDAWRASHPEEDYYFHADKVGDPAKLETLPSVILSNGQNVSYLFSLPCFIADTEFAGFLETTVRVEMNTLERLSTKLILLKASDVDKNPAGSEDITVKKTNIPPITNPQNEYEWLDYSRNLMCQWNAENSAVEIWKCIMEEPVFLGLNPRQRWRKIGHIPINPETLEIGEPVYELTGDKFPWGQWAVDQKMGWEKDRDRRETIRKSK